MFFYDFNRPKSVSFPKLSETSYFILLSLYCQSNHGYGVIIDVRDMTNGIIELKTATVYKALDRLVCDKFVTQSIENSQSIYSLSELGKQYLTYHYERLSWRISITQNMLKPY